MSDVSRLMVRTLREHSEGLTTPIQHLHPPGPCDAIASEKFVVVNNFFLSLENATFVLIIFVLVSSLIFHIFLSPFFLPRVFHI